MSERGRHGSLVVLLAEAKVCQTIVSPWSVGISWISVPLLEIVPSGLVGRHDDPNEEWPALEGLLLETLIACRHRAARPVPIAYHVERRHLVVGSRSIPACWRDTD